MSQMQKLTSQTYPVRGEHRENEKKNNFNISHLSGAVKSLCYSGRMHCGCFVTLNYGEIRINNRAADPQNCKTAELGEMSPIYIVFLIHVY